MLGKVLFKPEMVGRQYSRSDIRGALNENGRNLKPRLLLGVYRLKRLPVNQYNAFLQFIDQLIGKDPEQPKLELKLVLSSLDKLKTVDFEHLISEPKEKEKAEILYKARNEIFSRCYLPDGKPKIDFTHLPWIYREYVIIPEHSLKEK